MTLRKTITVKATDPKTGLTEPELTEFLSDVAKAEGVAVDIKARVNLRGGIKEISAEVVRPTGETD